MSGNLVYGVGDVVRGMRFSLLWAPSQPDQNKGLGRGGGAMRV
jgi:hypothetical protein